jgi:hypothetical protein
MCVVTSVFSLHVTTSPNLTPACVLLPFSSACSAPLASCFLETSVSLLYASTAQPPRSANRQLGGEKNISLPVSCCQAFAVVLSSLHADHTARSHKMGGAMTKKAKDQVPRFRSMCSSLLCFVWSSNLILVTPSLSALPSKVSLCRQTGGMVPHLLIFLPFLGTQ